MASYRVFVSYSHDDRKLVECLVRLLKSHGLTPLWDKDFIPGRDYHDEIKTYIAHAHVFMPVLTEAGSRRGWVHQEIGYAMALRVPVLPVCRGHSPGEMLQPFQAVTLDDDTEDELIRKLPRSVFDKPFDKATRERFPLFECAKEPEDRTVLLTRYAEQVPTVSGKQSFGRIRQRGAPGTFAIPNQNIYAAAWRARDPGGRDSQHRIKGLLAERQVLEINAREAGCRLIVDPMEDYDRNYGPGATRARLQTLVEFLQQDYSPGGNVEIVLDRRQDRGHGLRSVTLVGDWFVAEAVAGTTHGYRQTIFTRHAASVRSAIEEFDNEFKNLLDEQNIPAASSRDVAIQQLQELINQPPK
jgi:hypothetical protein